MKRASYVVILGFAALAAVACSKPAQEPVPANVVSGSVVPVANPLPKTLDELKAANKAETSALEKLQDGEIDALQAAKASARAAVKEKRALHRKVRAELRARQHAQELELKTMLSKGAVPPAEVSADTAATTVAPAATAAPAEVKPAIPAKPAAAHKKKTTAK
ncbi:MAG: hypothetical protein GX410_07265 [Elusimicrobia bacterium]|nr:hypothetical protein [Elusimicrobiota bacterium]